MKIYLAGGMRTEWREKIKGSNRNHIYVDPTTKEKSGVWDVEKYGLWDLHHIKSVDVVFGYMEKTNPSGIGLGCEIGYAYGIGKTIILVLEDENEYQKDRYLHFLKSVSHVTFNNIDEGIEFIKTFK